jgi:16S rRNA processing protein RimM
VVGRPHGLDGSFYVVRPRPELLDAGAMVTVSGVPREVVRRAGTRARPILRLSGCDSREAAEALRGSDLFVPRSAAPPLGEDEFWADELVGCAVVDGDQPIGTVRRLLAYPSCELLEVDRGEGGRDLLVPLVRDAIRAVDVEARVIDVALAFLGETASGKREPQPDPEPKPGQPGAEA